MTKKILLIEPDKILADVYQNALSSTGLNVEKAYNAQQGIILADNENPDLVICELQLVDHSGVEFLYEFRSYVDWLKIPIIIFSIVPPYEFSSCQIGLKRELGVESYLYKPQTNLHRLLEVVGATLNS